jgi:hypothetical protein
VQLLPRRGAGGGSFAVVAAGATVAALMVWTPAVAQTPSADGDDQISGQTYIRHDGGTDPGIQHCNDEATADDGEDPSSGGSLTDPDDDIVNSFVATSTTEALDFGDSVQVSNEGHQSAYEMFSNRQIPFHGDYNWIALALDEAGALFGYASWTDNRNVEPGTDPRELEEQDGFDDGFDVLQCRDDLADSVEGLLSPSMPLARRDAPFGGDTCANGGGLDQDIFGVSFTP